MSLSLGKTFNRNHNLRVPFLDGFYNIGVFFNNKSSFLLFGIDGDFFGSTSKDLAKSIKINMFKNIEAAPFCSSFLELHNYKSQTLDIVNQFKEIKKEYNDDIIFNINEDLVLSKYNVNDSVFYDQLILYGFTLSSYPNEFLFILAERQFINLRFKCKIVRTSGLQITTTSALNMIDRIIDNTSLDPDLKISMEK